MFAADAVRQAHAAGDGPPSFAGDDTPAGGN